MKYQHCLMGGDAFIKTLKVGATVAKDTFVIFDTNKYGQCTTCTTTSAADWMGLAISGGTYDATPTVAEGGEGTVQVIINPLAVYRGRAWGSAAKAELSAATLNVQTQTIASKTVLTSAAGYTNDKDTGTLFMLTGANAGMSRILTSHVDATSCTVTVAFPENMAVGDKGVAVQYGVGGSAGHTALHTMTTDLTGFDDSVALGTGAAVSVVDVELERPINATNPVIYVDFILTNHLFNPID